MDLSTEIQFLPGVGPKRAAILQSELGVYTLEHLLSVFPYKYVDRSRIYFVHEVSADLPYIQLEGRISKISKSGQGRNQRLNATFYDSTGSLELVWFEGIRFVEEKLSTTANYIVFGKPSVFNGTFNIVHPELEIATDANKKQLFGWQAFYNTSEKMKKHFLNSRALQKIIFTALQSSLSSIKETLPAKIIDEYHLFPLKESLLNIHAPQQYENLNKAKHRLKFEELFYIQLSILRKSKFKEEITKGFYFNKIGDAFNRFYAERLPFELTGAQKRVVKEIRLDVGSGKQMNRLLQGDVGSGKTLVALLSMLMAVDNGFQACLMAPTEILATQHYISIKEMLGEIGVNVALLTGSIKKKDRVWIHEGLQDGSLHLLIGTHALLEDTVKFANLGLVIIDEQHRFGVQQRARMWTKNHQPPHVLVMTATPIPRTLAMTVYGDLDISVIDELPPGRKPINTYHYYETKREAMYGFLQKQIDKGRQIYIVFPLIQESEKMDLQDLQNGYERIKIAFPSSTISMVHGKMKPAEKEAEMQKFVSAQTQIMVATTVIEVGVNVPNASVMVIENAERFGLSQLHQLRGRVGRGAEQSYCILLSSHKITTETRKRLEIMTQTNDGFVISEADMQLRGPGDMDGTAQSGMPFELKIANLAQDGHLVSLAREVAQQILELDRALLLPEHRILTIQLAHKARIDQNWGNIS